ncbi:maleylpyruvate isomerase N-terminal domain-containing protein [Streptomyces sp. NPDC059271]|uniref:maleylpyruvate isomerase N-terminal domain-containing protein n=1 Tax=Streptomyces sp. NPDC059271 TaxID=3346799 RepID=UPI0036BAB1FB
MKEIAPDARAFHELAAAADRLLAALDGLTDADAAAPSRLPGWSRGHVLSHLAAQAPALERLLTWARTGVETPQYASRAARDAEIEAGTRLSADALVTRVRQSAAHWQDAAESLPEPAWDATIRPFTGESCTPRRILVIRLRELVLHLVDLDLGHEIDGVPPHARDIVLADVLGYYAHADGVPAFTLLDAEGARLARFGHGGPVVRGTRAAHLAWLSGRSDGAALAADELPDLPPWI